MSGKMRLFSAALVMLLLVILAVAPVSSQSAGEMVPQIIVRSVTQAERPVEFETTRLVVENMKGLGLDVVHRAVPWSQLIDEVWFTREGDDAWEMTIWRMVGRPERSDPDEFAYNLFHSSMAASGYNFVGYNNPDYDAIAEAQRAELDKSARQQLLFDAQEMIASDVPNVYFAHPSTPQLVRTDVWDVDTVVTQAGIGIHNFWTWTGLTPTGSQDRIITSTTSYLEAFNPLYIAGDAPSRVTELIWDRLMRIGPDGLPRPWAAESVVWEDEVTVVVTLRKGMMWHDGEAVTSDDVVYSIEAVQSGEAPQYSPFAKSVASTEVIDDLTVRMHLSEPSAAFETSTLAKLNLLPEHVWRPIIEDLMTKDDANAESIQEDIPVGSGPYKMVAFDVNEYVILERNDDHFSPAMASGWIMNVLPNAEATLGQISTGEINFLWEWAGDSEILAEIAEMDPSIALFSSPSLGMRYFAFNLRMAPFDDVALRRAVAHVVPKDSIVNNIYKGFAVTADSYVSTPIEFWHNPDLPQYAYDVDMGREVLADAGYTWDDDGRLHYPAE